jgi:hypothetical protein
MAQQEAQVWYAAVMERIHWMDECLLQEIEEAKERDEDLGGYLVRIERCRWEHDVTSCEICRQDGVLPAQECVFKVYNLGVRS